MATNKKLMKYQEFSPNITAQNDKRNLQRARDDLEAAVAKYYNVLGFPSFAGIPIVDSKRGVVGLEIFAMGETVKNIFNEDLKTTILEAFQVSSIEILAKLKDKKDGKEVDPEQAVGEDVVQLPKPPKPVFNMNSGEAIAYFSQLKSTVAHLDGVKIKRKWPKKKDGVLVEEATPLTSFDENVESILPSNQYFGSNTKFQPGNLLWRLQLVCAYILTKFGHNYNTFAQVIPADYVAKDWQMADLVTLSNNPEANVQKRRRRNKVDNIVEHERHWLDTDEYNNYEDDESVGGALEDDDVQPDLAEEPEAQGNNPFSDSDQSFDTHSSGSPRRQVSETSSETESQRNRRPGTS